MVIGAGVSRDEETGITAKCYVNIGISDLARIRKTDDDFIKLVGKLKGGNPALDSKICVYILDHCGGHVFPTLFFIEYFLAGPKSPTRPCFENFDQFIKFFNGSTFPKSEIFNKMQHRCFTLSSVTNPNPKHTVGWETLTDTCLYIHVGPCL